MKMLKSLHALRNCLYLILFCYCAPSLAAVTCDQLGNIALATEQYRNQGEPLQVLLAEADKLEGGGMSKEDLIKVKKTVQETYDRTRTALEVRTDCKDAPRR